MLCFVPSTTSVTWKTILYDSSTCTVNDTKDPLMIDGHTVVPHVIAHRFRHAAFRMSSTFRCNTTKFHVIVRMYGCQTVQIILKVCSKLLMISAYIEKTQRKINKINTSYFSIYNSSVFSPSHVTKEGGRAHTHRNTPVVDYEYLED